MKNETDHTPLLDYASNYSRVHLKCHRNYPVLSDLSFVAAVLSGLVYGMFFFHDLANMHQVSLLGNSRQEAYVNEFASRSATSIAIAGWREVQLASAVLLLISACVMLTMRQWVGLGLHVVYVVAQISASIAIGVELNDSLFMPLRSMAFLIWLAVLASCVYPLIVVAVIILTESTRLRSKQRAGLKWT